MAHTSDITVGGNAFVNLAAGNDPALNLQRALRVTSHSSLTTTVEFENNSIDGASIGFQWLTGQNFAGNLAVILRENQITDSATGVLVQSNGIAHLTHNVITGERRGRRCPRRHRRSHRCGRRARRHLPQCHLRRQRRRHLDRSHGGRDRADQPERSERQRRLRPPQRRRAVDPRGAQLVGLEPRRRARPRR